MKKTFLGLLPIIVAMLSSHISAQTTDSVDVLNYRIYLDVNHNVSQTFVGHTDVSVQLLRQVPTFTLDLQTATVDSVTVNGTVDSVA